MEKIDQKAEDYRAIERVTYKMIQEDIENKYGFKVYTVYIAEVKRDPMYDAPNAAEELKHERKHLILEKSGEFEGDIKNNNHNSICIYTGFCNWNILSISRT